MQSYIYNMETMGSFNVVNPTIPAKIFQMQFFFTKSNPRLLDNFRYGRLMSTGKIMKNARE